MLIDWVTVRVCLTELSPAALDAALGVGDRITRYCPKTGEEVYTTAAWDSVRSDSHQLAVRVGSDLWIQGSPARCIGAGDTVFGAGASADLDLLGCVRRMILFVSTKLGVALPPAEKWIVSRVDVTGNLLLGSLSDVRSALTVLRDCEGGRYRVSAQAGDTVYWSIRSKHRKGKAYAKGPHLRHLMKQKTYTGVQYTETEIEQADRLLRLELTLGREWFARCGRPWFQLTSEALAHEWRTYFDRMIGEADMPTNDDDLMQKVISVAPSEGQGRAAFGMWLFIQSRGWESARDSYARRTWYHNLKILRAAGFGDADISRGEIVQLRRRVLAASVVNSWAEIAA